MKYINEINAIVNELNEKYDVMTEDVFQEILEKALELTTKELFGDYNMITDEDLDNIDWNNVEFTNMIDEE